MTHGTYQSHGMQRPRRIVTILTVLALSISLGACGTAGDRKQEQSLRGQASAISGDADANAADASYRDEIAKIKNSGSTEAAQILEDGKITEEELVQLGSSYAQCLTSKGITVDTGEARYPGGSISPSYGDNALDKRNLSEDEIAATNAADEACQNETQYKNIVDLYLSLKENPENVDTDQLGAPAERQDTGLPEKTRHRGRLRDRRRLRRAGDDGRIRRNELR